MKDDLDDDLLESPELVEQDKEDGESDDDEE